MNPDNPLIVQSDHTILVEVASPRYVHARDALLGFAELLKSPEHVHTYRITPLSIWNACAAGLSADSMIGALREYAHKQQPKHLRIHSGAPLKRMARDGRGSIDTEHLRIHSGAIEAAGTASAAHAEQDNTSAFKRWPANVSIARSTPPANA